MDRIQRRFGYRFSAESDSLSFNLFPNQMTDSLQPALNLEMPENSGQASDFTKISICALSLNYLDGDAHGSKNLLDRLFHQLFNGKNTFDHHRLHQLHHELYGKASELPCYDSIQVEKIIEKLNCQYLLLYESSSTPSEQWIQEALALLDSHKTDIVIGPQAETGPINSLLGRFITFLTTCTAPDARTMLLRKPAFSHRPVTLRPAGRWLSVELQLRVPQDRRVYLADSVAGRPAVGKPGMPGRTELSFIKSYIDHRFGNASRLIQFCAVGFSGMFVDLTSYAVFQELFRNTVLNQISVPLIGGTFDLALAGLLAVTLAMTWNFLLNRRLTFNDARKNASIVRQYLTYAMGNALAIGVSLLIRLWLPTKITFFNDHKLAAALVGIVLATGISFSMARYFVFKSDSSSPSS